MEGLRKRLEAALAKPLPEVGQIVHSEIFNPWEDVIDGIHGSYSSESDDLMLEALKAARDTQTFEFIGRKGFAAEFALYVLSGHGMLDYGTSPRGGWPDHEIADLWQPLIDKWEAYADIVWERSPTPHQGED